MRVFKSLASVDAASLPPPVHAACHESLSALINAYAEAGETYRWWDDGYVVLVEQEDVGTSAGADRLRQELGHHTLLEAPFEGVLLEGGVFKTCLLFNNQFGLTVIIPDAPWLPSSLRARLIDEAA